MRFINIKRSKNSKINRNNSLFEWILKNKYTVVSLIIFLVLLISSSFNIIIAEDTFYLKNFNTYLEEKNFLPYVGHLPLTDYFLFPFFYLFKTNMWFSERLPFLIFGISSFFLFYMIAKKHFNKEILNISLFLFSTHPAHAFFLGSLTPPNELSLFCILGMTYFLFEIKISDKKNKLKNYLMSGIFFALCIINYESMAILAVPIIVYLFLIKEINLKNIKEISNTIVKGILYILPSFVFTTLIFVFDIFINKKQLFVAPNIIYQTFVAPNESLKAYTGLISTAQPTIIYYFSMIAIFIIFGYILFLPIIKLNKKTFENKEIIFAYSAIAIFTLFYIVLLQAQRYQIKYITAIIPIICLVLAYILVENKIQTNQLINKKSFAIIALFFIVFEAILIYFPAKNLSYNDPAFIKEALFSNFTLIMPNVQGLVFPLILIAIFCTISGLVFILWFIFNKRQLALLFVLICISFNFVVMGEYAFHLQTPNYNAASKEIVAYSLSNNLQEPIYLIRENGFETYLSKKYSDIRNFDVLEKNQTLINEFKENLNTKGGSIVFMNMPFIDKEGKLWEIINGCTIQKKIESNKKNNNETLAIISVCNTNS